MGWMNLLRMGVRCVRGSTVFSSLFLYFVDQIKFYLNSYILFAMRESHIYF